MQLVCRWLSVVDHCPGFYGAIDDLVCLALLTNNRDYTNIVANLDGELY
jgi:hypothetical protein